LAQHPDSVYWLQATEHAGWQRGRIQKDENESREWAVQYLKHNGHTGRCDCAYKFTVSGW
jgi:hypothetical protein